MKRTDSRPRDDAIAGTFRERQKLGGALPEVPSRAAAEGVPITALLGEADVMVARLIPESSAAPGRKLPRRHLTDEIAGGQAEPREKVGGVDVAEVHEGVGIAET